MPRVFRWVICAILLAMIMYMVGLWGTLFGPASLALVSTAALLMTCGCAALVVRRGNQPGTRGIENLGLSEGLETACDLFLGLLVIIIVVCFVTMISIPQGVAQFPVFEKHAHYVLSNHGHHTEVSRLRYCLAGGSFTLGWHSLGMLFATAILRATLTGDLSFFQAKR